jgi:hypothetical protein
MKKMNEEAMAKTIGGAGEAAFCYAIGLTVGLAAMTPSLWGVHYAALKACWNS